MNGILIPGNALDATGEPGANAGRFGHFSDIYYDPNRREWWALSDRGPGGGLLDYSTRLQRFDIDVHPVTGRISNFRVKETIRFRDRFGFLLAPTAPVGDAKALNGLNPGLLNLDPALPGRTFDPEGLAIDPRTGHFLVADEYGPSLYEFYAERHVDRRVCGSRQPRAEAHWRARLRGRPRRQRLRLGTPGQSRLRRAGRQPGRKAALRRPAGSAPR